MRSIRLPAVIWGACLLLIVVTLAVAACSGSACAATWVPDRGGSGGFGYSGGGGKGGTTGTSSGSKGGTSSGSKGSGTSGGGRSYPPPRLTTITYLNAPAAGTYHYRIAAEGMPMRSVGPNVYYQYNGGWYPGYMYGGYFYLYDDAGDC